MPMTASSSDKTVFYRNRRLRCHPGIIQRTVTSLASAQQLLSECGWARRQLGHGGRHRHPAIRSAASSFKVTIDGTDDTVAGIAARINSASGNPGSLPRFSLAPTAHTGAVLIPDREQPRPSVTETDGGSALSSLTYAAGRRRGTTHRPRRPSTRASRSPAWRIRARATPSPGALGGVTLNFARDKLVEAPRTSPSPTDTTTVQRRASEPRGCLQHSRQARSLPWTLSTARHDTAGPMMGSALLEGIRRRDPADADTVTRRDLHL